MPPKLIKPEPHENSILKYFVSKKKLCKGQPAATWPEPGLWPDEPFTPDKLLSASKKPQEISSDTETYQETSIIESVEQECVSVIQTEPEQYRITIELPTLFNRNKPASFFDDDIEENSQDVRRLRSAPPTILLTPPHSPPSIETTSTTITTHQQISIERDVIILESIEEVRPNSKDETQQKRLKRSAENNSTTQRPLKKRAKLERSATELCRLVPTKSNTIDEQQQHSSLSEIKQFDLIFNSKDKSEIQSKSDLIDETKDQINARQRFEMQQTRVTDLTMQIASRQKEIDEMKSLLIAEQRQLEVYKSQLANQRTLSEGPYMIDFSRKPCDQPTTQSIRQKQQTQAQTQAPVQFPSDDEFDGM